MYKALSTVSVIHRRSHVQRGFRTLLALLTAALGAAAGRACGIVYQMVAMYLLEGHVNAKYLDVHIVSWHKGHAFRLGNYATGALHNSVLSSGHWEWHAIPINQHSVRSWYHSIMLTT